MSPGNSDARRKVLDVAYEAPRDAHLSVQNCSICIGEIGVDKGASSTLADVLRSATPLPGP